MKKFFTIVLVCSLLFLLAGCNKDEVESNNVPNELSEEEITYRLQEIANDLTDVWNNVINEVKWYAEDGTNSVGEELDIEFLIDRMDVYYDKIKEDKKFIDQLSDDYSNFKDSFNKAYEQAIKIYDEIKQETPVANSELSYLSDIELFSQYYMAFYNDAWQY